MMNRSVRFSIWILFFASPLLFHSRTEILFDLPFGIFFRFWDYFEIKDLVRVATHLGSGLYAPYGFQKFQFRNKHQEHPQLGPFKVVHSFVSPWCFVPELKFLGISNFGKIRVGGSAKKNKSSFFYFWQSRRRKKSKKNTQGKLCLWVSLL